MKLAMFNDGIDTQGEQIYSILMVGQSNMSGRGELKQEAQIENPNCFMFRMGRWQKMCEPINADRPYFGINFPSGACLATSFADAMANYYGIKVGLIPCADGGTCMDEWENGTPLYDHAVMLAKLAMRTSKLAGIIWHQGESDCATEEMAKAHEQKFLTMIKSLKEDIGAVDVPVIIGELARDYSPNRPTLSGDRPKIINDGYHHIASQNENFAVVSSKGLELKADGLHFNLKSLREFGLRYFDEFKKFINEDK